MAEAQPQRLQSKHSSEEAVSPGSQTSTLLLDPVLETIENTEEDQSSVEAAGVFCGFLTGQNENDEARREGKEADVAMQLEKESNATQVGRKLANISKVVDDKYGHEFDSLAMDVVSMSMGDDDLYEKFSRIAKRMLCSENINWGRIIALFCFGYKLAIRGATRVAQFLSKLVKTVVRFLISEGILQWVRMHGGWAGALVNEAAIAIVGTAVKQITERPFVSLLALGIIVSVVVWRYRSS